MCKYLCMCGLQGLRGLLDYMVCQGLVQNMKRDNNFLKFCSSVQNCPLCGRKMAKELPFKPCAEEKYLRAHFLHPFLCTFMIFLCGVQVKREKMDGLPKRCYPACWICRLSNWWPWNCLSSYKTTHTLLIPYHFEFDFNWWPWLFFYKTTHILLIPYYFEFDLNWWPWNCLSSYNNNTDPSYSFPL